MTSNWWFRALQAGDEVALWQDGKGRRETVTRTTKTQILIGDLRFSRRDGYGIGSTCGFLRAADSLGAEA